MISKYSLSLNYPLAFHEAFKRNRGRADLYLLYSLARKESRFNPLAVSPANAQGLLQLNPTTAKRLDSGSTGRLLEIDTNIELGANYVTQLLRKYNDRMHLSVAAYNAGESAVDTWKRRYPSEHSLLFIDLISYRETRDYVGYVLTNYYWYRRLYDNADTKQIKNRIALERK